MSEAKKPGWRNLPIGGVITKPGNSEEYKTGGWRIKKPLWSEDKCIQCLLCWSYCPDLAFFTENGEITGVDYDHCKGCGICANQCPTKALEMVSEDESDVNDKNEQKTRNQKDDVEDQKEGDN